MIKESFPIPTQQFQIDAPGMYGTHFIDILPFSGYHPAFKYFFQSLPKNRDAVSLLDVASGNENRVLAGMNEFGRPIDLTAVDIETPSSIGKLPNNVLRKFATLDLREHWPYPENSFDGVIFAWALHWFGESGSKNALDSTARVLKPGHDAIISTLTPFDGLIANHVFERSKISKRELHRLYPGAQVIGKQRLGSPVWTVKNDEEIKTQLRSGKGFAVKHSHPLSIIGEKELIGFTPQYFRSELIRRNLDIIMEVIKPNRDFPNSYSPTLNEGKTQLIYVVRKKIS